MSSDFSSFCDDFYLNARLVTKVPLPTDRHALLHFFEQVQKHAPAMTRFVRTDTETSLEEDRSSGTYRWVSAEPNRLACGHVNPPQVMAGLDLHTFVFDQAFHQLGLSHLELDYVEVLAGFDLSFAGNHDEVVAESLLGGSAIASLLDEPGARPVDCSPHMTVSLSDDCRLQARLDVVTRTSSYQLRMGQYDDEVISVYAVIRRYADGTRVNLPAQVTHLAERLEQLCQQHVLPRVVQPLHAAISRRL